MRLGGVIGGTHGLRIGHVKRQADHLRAGLGGQCGGGLWCVSLDRSNGNLGAFFGKALGNATPDTLVAPGDEYRLACETCHGLSSIKRGKAKGDPTGIRPSAVPP